jgi:hypothetical protein
MTHAPGEKWVPLICLLSTKRSASPSPLLGSTIPSSLPPTKSEAPFKEASLHPFVVDGSDKRLLALFSLGNADAVWLAPVENSSVPVASFHVATTVTSPGWGWVFTNFYVLVACVFQALSAN